MGLVLSGGHASVPHLQHVRVIPAIGSCIRPPLVIQICSIDHCPPIILDILSCSPAVAYLRGPGSRVVHPPLTQGVEYGPSSFVQGLLHHWIALLRRYSVAVAVVVLEVVDFPFGVRLRVLCLVREGAGSPRARLVTRVAVEAEEEAFGVNVVDHSLEVGEGGRVWLNVAGRATRAGPAVVNVHVLVAELRKVVCDEGVCSGLENSLVDAAVVVIPRVPAHLRSATQTVVIGKHSHRYEHAHQQESCRHLSFSPQQLSL